MSEAIPRRRLLTSDWSEITKLSLPIFASSGFVVVSGVVDTAVMGWASVEGLAGVAAAVAIFTIAFGIPSSISIAHQITAAKSFGGSRPSEVGSSLRHALAIGALLSFVVIALVLLLGDPAVTAITGPGGAAEAGSIYLKIRSLELIFAIPLLLLIGTFGARKDTKTGMYAFAVANGVNVSLDLVLVIWLRMDALGNAIATVVGTLAALVFILTAVRGSRLLREITFDFTPFHLPQVRSLISLASPVAISGALDYLGVLALFAILGRLGTEQIAAGRLDFAVMVMSFGLLRSVSSASQILMGRAYGALDWPRVELLRSSATAMLVVFGIAAGAVLIALPHQLLSLMTSFGRLADVGTPGLQLVGLSLPLMGLTLVSAAGLRAIGRPKLDMYANVAAVWIVQVPFAVVVTQSLGWGLEGVFASFIAYWIARAALGNVFWMRERARRATP